MKTNEDYTMEVRHHEGTINAERILHWCKFLLLFLEKSKHVLLRLDKSKVNMEMLWNFIYDEELKHYFIKD